MPRSFAGPNFICIGLRKAGTRWLYQQLDAHPDFAMPPIKELHFFDRKFPPNRVDPARRARPGQRPFVDLLAGLPRRAGHDLDTYEKLFEFAGDRLTGDITPAYGNTLQPARIAALAQRFPKTLVLMMLRDPVARAWSNLNDVINKGRLVAADALSAERIERALALPVLADASFPSEIHARWHAAFGERLGVAFLDDVVADADAARGRIVALLGGRADAAGDVAASGNDKAGRPRQPMSAEVRAFLAGHFAAELERCAALFGGHAVAWREKYAAVPAPA